MGESGEEFWGNLVGEFRGSNWSSDGPEVFRGGESKTNGGYVQRTRSPGLDETTTGPQSPQGHGGEMLRFWERDSAGINRSR